MRISTKLTGHPNIAHKFVKQFRFDRILLRKRPELWLASLCPLIFSLIQTGAVCLGIAARLYLAILFSFPKIDLPMKKFFCLRASSLSLILMTLLSVPLAVGRLSAQTSFCGSALGTVIGTQNSSTVTWANNATYTVTGTLTINQNLTLDAVSFQMNPSSSIRILNGVKFTVTNSIFKGCATMWSGIYILSGATIDFQNCTVKDATIAMRFSPGFDRANSQLETVRFYNNLTGIAANFFPKTAPFQLKTFSNNNFGTSQPFDLLKVPPLSSSGASAYAGSQLFRGIWVLGGAADLSHGAALPNKLDNLRYGIKVESATVTVGNCRFSNMTNDLNIMSDQYDGTGIHAQSSVLLVTGTGNNNCRFVNSFNADIYSRKTGSLTVNGIRSEQLYRYGIYCAESDLKNAVINLQENTFVTPGVHFISAIYVERPPSPAGASAVLIRRNDVTVGPYTIPKNPKVLIDVVGKHDAQNEVRIERCTLTVNSAKNTIHGIRIGGKGDNYLVQDHNVLNYLPDATPISVSPSYGIIAQNLLGKNNLILANEITSILSGQYSYLGAGIHLENNPLSLLVCENVINNTHKGIDCLAGLGNLGNTYLKKNLLGNAAYGLWCSSLTVMPNQDRFENRWTGSYAVFGAKYDVLNSQLGFQIFYDNTNAILDDIPANMSWSPTNWFQTALGSNSYCGVGVEPLLTGKEQQLIDGTLAADTSTTNWDARYGLLYKLLYHPEIVAGDEDAAKYLDDNITNATSPWKFANAEQQFDAAYVVSTSLNNRLSTYSAQYRVLADSIVLLDGLQAQDTTTYDATIAKKRADVFGRLCTAADDLSGAQNEAATANLSNLQSVATYVANLPTTKQYESNLRTVLGIAVRYAQGDSLVTADSTSLRSVAAQCQQYGGTSIRRAPHWLNEAEDIRYIDKNWDTNCTVGARTMVVLTGTNLVLIAPNPADGYLRVLWPVDQGGQWYITDLTGRTVRHDQWLSTESDLVIGTADWQPGLYFLQTRTDAGSTSTVKFIIYH